MCLSHNQFRVFQKIIQNKKLTKCVYIRETCCNSRFIFRTTVKYTRTFKSDLFSGLSSAVLVRALGGIAGNRVSIPRSIFVDRVLSWFEALAPV